MPWKVSDHLCDLHNLTVPSCDVAGHGGGWGYSAHSVEAIRFCADADILLGGLGLFGGRGEYTAKIKVCSPLKYFYKKNALIAWMCKFLKTISQNKVM